MKSIYRKLTAAEIAMVLHHKLNRPHSQKVAYSLLPESMKRCVERDPGIAFADSSYCFSPDLFFRKEKFLIEIDGGYHYMRKREDKYRDEVFADHGFKTIRISSVDTQINVAFWQQILKALKEQIPDQKVVKPFIKELQRLIDAEIKSLTKLTWDEDCMCYY